MKHSFDYIVEALKRARKEKGFSQKELGEKVGIKQSHISKIESGLVDLQASSVVEISRILDLEPMLIPRQLVRVVEALIRSKQEKEGGPGPMYQLDDSAYEE